MEKCQKVKMSKGRKVEMSKRQKDEKTKRRKDEKTKGRDGGGFMLPVIFSSCEISYNGCFVSLKIVKKCIPCAIYVLPAAQRGTPACPGWCAPLPRPQFAQD